MPRIDVYSDGTVSKEAEPGKLYLEVMIPYTGKISVFPIADVLEGYIVRVNPIDRWQDVTIYFAELTPSGSRRFELHYSAAPGVTVKPPQWRVREGAFYWPSGKSRTTPWYDVPNIKAISGVGNAQAPLSPLTEFYNRLFQGIGDLFGAADIAPRDLFGPEINPFGTLLGDLFPDGKGGPFDGTGSPGVSGLFGRGPGGGGGGTRIIGYTPGVGSNGQSPDGDTSRGGFSKGDRQSLDWSGGVDDSGAPGGAPAGGAPAGGAGHQGGAQPATRNKDSGSKDESGDGTGKRRTRHVVTVKVQDSRGNTISEEQTYEVDRPDPTRNPTGLTGVAFLDDIAMRTARLQGSMISAPLGPARAFGDGEGGGPGVTDVSGVVSLDPLAPVAGEIYGGRDPRRPRGYYSGGIDNPYIERLDPDTGSDAGGGGSEGVIIQRILGERPRTPGGEGGDPHARLGGGGTVVAVSAGGAAGTKTPI